MLQKRPKHLLQVLSTCGQLASVSTLICTLLKLAKSLFEQLRVRTYDVTRRQLDHSAVHTCAVCSTPARAAMLRHGAPGSAILTWMLRSSSSISRHGDQTNSALEHYLDRLASCEHTQAGHVASWHALRHLSTQSSWKVHTTSTPR